MSTFNREAISNLFDDATVEQVKLSDIIIDAGTQQRAKMNAEAIENYMHAMQNGEASEFPAIKLVRLIEPVTLPDGTELEAGALILADGFHRTDAAVGAKLATFQSFIADGTLQDAIYYSMTANSTNGVNLQGKDYQIAIKKLYTLANGYWREHGRKKEIAALFGCSTKTVERATAAIDKATKAEAFKMFEKGEDLNHIADVSFKSLKTIKQWFEEWTKAQEAKEEPKGPEGEQGTNQEQHQNAGTNNPLDLTFAEVLALKDSALKAKLLKLLMDSVAKDEPQQEEPKQEEPQPEPQQDAEEPEGDAMKDLANLWRGQDWWVILGLDLVKLNGMAKPKAAIKRAYNKALKQCHSDKHGANEALEILKDALAASAKMYK